MDEINGNERRMPMAKMKGGSVTPILQSLVLAEMVLQARDGRYIIVGTFDTLLISRPSEDNPVEKTDPPEENQGSKGSPDSSVNPRPQKYVVRGGQSGSPWAYLCLTDVCDRTKLQLQFVSLKKNKVLFEQSLEITSNDRLRNIEFACGLPHLGPFMDDLPGVYAFEVVCEGQIIGSYRIRAETPK